MNNKLLSSLLYTICSVVIYFALTVFSNIQCFMGLNNVYSFHFSPYHKTHVYAFLITIGFAFLLSLHITNIWKNKTLQYIVFYTKWVVISSVLGGILWSYYDMKNGWFPIGELLYKKVLEDMLWGISYGYIVVFASFPFNIFILITSMVIIKINKLI